MVISEDHRNSNIVLPKDIGTDFTFKRQIVWFNAIGFLLLHIIALYGLALIPQVHFYTLVWCVFCGIFSGLGVTIGAHRLYAHKAFKATFSLRLLLIILHTIAGQNCMYIWVRDHRQHHKYSDTDADPHNATRGFFFSHIGWLMSRKHPDVINRGKQLDLSDLEADKLIMFQKKYYKILYVIFALALPILVPMYYWNETVKNSIFVSYFARYLISLNITWLINSANHMFGYKPYDRTIKSTENRLVAFLSIGEGWHNYHHTFPWDYRAAEFGLRYSLTTATIDMLAHFGFIYDLKEASSDMVKHRIEKKGDGNHPELIDDNNNYKSTDQDNDIRIRYVVSAQVPVKIPTYFYLLIKMVVFTLLVLQLVKISSEIRINGQGKICGRPIGTNFKLESENRIVGGYDVGYYRYPWYAAFTMDDTVVCGGVLIGPRIVLTAGHCYKSYDTPNNQTEERTTMENLMNVTLGLYNKCEKEPTRRTFLVDKVIVHEKYKENFPYFDIALVLLKGDTNNFEPICLPNNHIKKRPKEGTAPGMGTLRYHGSTPCTLHEVRLLIYHDDICRDMLNRTDNDPAKMVNGFCAGYLQGGIDTCQGDSGGPFQITDDQGNFILLGLVSFGFGCAYPGYLGMYTDVSKFLDWIEKTANKKLRSRQVSNEQTTPPISLPSHHHHYQFLSPFLRPISILILRKDRLNKIKKSIIVHHPIRNN